jgi:hypothetical protein
LKSGKAKEAKAARKEPGGGERGIESDETGGSANRHDFAERGSGRGVVFDNSI